MVKVTTVKSWGFRCLRWEKEEGSDHVKSIHCGICRDFYTSQNSEGANNKGAVKKVVDKFITGSTVIKKCNFEDHVKKSELHRIAALRMHEKESIAQRAAGRENTSTSAPPAPPPPSNQTTLLPHIQRFTAQQKAQLTRKFQLAHFTATNGKSFNSYEKFANFEKMYHNVDLGNAYCTDTAGTEIAKYISISKRIKNITEPLNQNVNHYYSVLMDGSSSVKILDEKELYIIKLCVGGVPKYEVMSLEEPNEANAEGLKESFENSISKMEFNFERKDKEIGMCSDGTNVNISLHRLVKAEMGEHYLLVLCPAHKLELALADAFKDCNINNTCEKDYLNIYYLFRKAPLRWRLFKRQAQFMEIQYRKYKRPEGTRWVEHQIAGLDSHLHNLPILLGFLNQQIADPHNKSIKDIVPKLQGIESNITVLKRILFNYIKLEILTTIRPLSKILQEISLIQPEFVTICKKTLENIRRMKIALQHKGHEAFQNVELFPKTNAFLAKLSVENEEIIPMLPRTRTNDATAADRYVLYNGYLLKGNIQDDLSSIAQYFVDILEKLHEAFETRFSPMLDDPVFIAMATFLDTGNYKHQQSSDELFDNSVKLIYDRFETLFQANGCDKTLLKTEFRTLFTHVTTFLKNMSSTKCWPQLFQLQDSLSLRNILHITELCIAIPLSNAECERVFSFMWRIYNKDRASMSHETLERLLQLRIDSDFSAKNYMHAVELFLTEYPDGSVRKRARRLDGHSYPSTRKSRGVSNEPSFIEIHDAINRSVRDIDLNQISDDDWTSDSDSDDI